jgi:putative heme-binding domain-containing protein
MIRACLQSMCCRLLLGLVVVGVLAVSQALAEEGCFFTQKPSVMPTQEKPAPPPVPVEVSKGRRQLGTGPAPVWIWGSDPNQRYFLRKEFTGGSKEAWLKATCDNRMTLFLNGKEVVQSDTWESPVEVDVQKYLRPGTNELVAEVANAGGPSGFVLKLALLGADNQVRHLISDKSWKVAEKKDATEWGAVRTLGKMGAGPWNDVFSQPADLARATPNVFNVLEGYQVELLYTVPKATLGSWVSITFDPKGRLLASDQGNKGLCRITPPPPGSDQPTRVEHLPVKITAAQGMLHAFGSLYLSVNGGPGSGLYRARDTNGDDQYDEVVLLKRLKGGGEHGPHALRLSPDGKSIYVIAGNHTDPPDHFDSSRLPRNWGEDLLLPRQWDARGHARGRLAPGGWIARTDPDGKTWEIFSSGYRNSYDMAFNADGELFAYDADMEWDMGTPWYRPTRVVHATSGSEFGWRSGTGKWPTYYPDSLPPLINIGPGSPVGVAFGYGTRFPAKYQKALYICDWTFGTMYALHIEPDGASYQAVKEEFLSRTPLPLTDIAVGPDGALYFTIGGRGTQSALYRVTYTGKESRARVDPHNKEGAKLRELRRQLESYHRRVAAPPIDLLWSNLGHADRHIRYAARVALENQDVKRWQERIVKEQDPDTLITASIALARQGEKALAPLLLTALDRLDFAKLSEEQQLGLLRAWSLIFIRMGEPLDRDRVQLVKKLDPFYPAKSDALNRELCQLLVYLKSPTVITKTIALMKRKSKPKQEQISELLARNRGYGGTIARMLANLPEVEKIHYAFALRNLREGWTPEQRVFYFRWLQQARQRSGGASYQGFIDNIGKEAYANASDIERLAIEASGARKPVQVKVLPKPTGPGRAWTSTEVLALAQKQLKGRNFANGKRAYAAARCVVCHRFAGEGGATGPDLTQAAGRFTLQDLVEAILEPSKVISDQYKASIIATTKGKVHTGRIVSEDDKGVTILVDPEDSTKVVEVPKNEIEENNPSPLSMMPGDLLKPLNQEEVLDLLAYVLSRGDPRDPRFQRR